MDPHQSMKCKIVVAGDSQCGKTALIHIFAKDCFPEKYLKYTASFQLDTHRVQLSLWDTSGQISVLYIECSALQNRVRSIFQTGVSESLKISRASRPTSLSSRPDLESDERKDRSCALM